MILANAFGHLLERDHLLEGRFWRHFMERLPLHRDDFPCVFAPKNAYVRDELVKRGWAHFDYDHLSKTQAMKQLIPHGKEDAFTTAEIWMAHWLAIVDVQVDTAARTAAQTRFDVVVGYMVKAMAKSKREGKFVTPTQTPAQSKASPSPRSSAAMEPGGTRPTLAALGLPSVRYRTRPPSCGVTRTWFASSPTGEAERPLAVTSALGIKLMAV